ncbi:hypothetical protein KAH37_08275 [bacterium]|nr:hypothetical protein [bacterium]
MDADIVTDTDVIVDYDNDLSTFDSDGDSVIFPDGDISNDSDTAEECLPPLTEITFPLTDKDGNMTFCRECDTPTELDPQCIANLWKDSNERLCVDEPEHDCCGYPCEMKNLKPMTKKFIENSIWAQGISHSGYALDRCDIMINPEWWDSGAYQYKSYAIENGKVVFEASNVKVDWKTYSHLRLHMEFDINTLQYRVLTGNALDNIASSGGNVLFSLYNTKNGQVDAAKYLIYRGKNGKMITVYPKPFDDFPGNPGMNDKWVFNSIAEIPPNGYKSIYAKVGEWKWQTIEGLGFMYTESLVGNKVTFFVDGFKGYQCDLSKMPRKLDDCLRIDREGENLRSPIMDLNTPTNNHIIYYSINSKPSTFVRADVSKTPFEYIEHQFILPDYAKPLLGTQLQTLKENILLFGVIYGASFDDAERLSCFYRLDIQKTFCTKPVKWTETSVGEQTDMGSSDFEGHTLIWQDSGRPLLKARDMECYCDWNSELCPFDDYTPNTEHPKRDGFRDERCEDKTNCDYTDIP